eukprot:m.224061 g.224061  ORF g.224061 m.224061 type:complete len:190 (+) comp17029_c0_seq2:2639-3208(+)
MSICGRMKARLAVARQGAAVLTCALTAMERRMTDTPLWQLTATELSALTRAGEVSAEELVSVIAHELGHVALGHTRKRMIDFSGQNAVRVVLATVLGRLLPGIGVLVANGLVHLLAAGLSRKDEYEADEYAAALLTKAGIGTGGQKSLLTRLESLTGMRGAPPVWLASHPKTADRVAAIEELERRWRVT